MNHTLTYDHYYLYEEIVGAMRKLAALHPEMARIETIGTSTEGRAILLMSVTDPGTGAFEDKPGYYVEANIHAGEVTGSMTVLRLMDTLLTNAEEPSIAALLKRVTFYLLPRVSPDGSEYYLTTPYAVRSLPQMYPWAEEQPGLQPADLDGDGAVRMMRVKTPYGAWKKSTLDDRLMTRRLPDDVEGDFYQVYTEGLLKDDEGIMIHDAPQKLGHDFNRSYPYAWRPEWEQHGSGRFPLENNETRANATYLMEHPNICSCVDMHTCGGMILYTPGYKSGKQADPQDMRLYRTLGQMAAEESGFPLLNVYDDFSPQSDPATYGGFDDFCHFMIGIPAFTIECWDLAHRAGIEEHYPPLENQPEKDREADEVKKLHWLDENVPEGEGFKPWTPFEHPQLGMVEIGGVYNKFTEQNPPFSFLEQEVEKHTRFMLREAKALPHLVLDSVKTEKLAEGICRVEAVIGNTGFMPTYVFREALKNKTLQGIKACLSGAEIVEGKPEQELGQLQGYSGTYTLDWGIPARSMESEPCRKKATWIVRGAAGDKVTLKAGSPRAGHLETEIVLP